MPESDDLALAFEQRDTKTIHRLLDERMQAEPKHPRWHYNRGVAFDLERQVEQANNAYKRALTLHPHHVGALTNLARNLDDLQEWEEALELYDRAITTDRGQQDPILHANRANTLLSLERFEQALAGYQLVLDFAPDDVPALAGRQTALMCLGRITDANKVRPKGTQADRGELIQLTAPLKDQRLVLRYWQSPRHTQPEMLKKVAQGMLKTAYEFSTTEQGIKDGTRINWGFSTILMRAANGDLVMCEPDFANAPFHEMCWDVSFTLQNEFMSEMLHGSMKLPYTPCSMYNQIHLTEKVLTRQKIRMVRLHKTDDNGVSGWLITADDDQAFLQALKSRQTDGEGLRAMQSGLLSLIRHGMIRVLGLPVGHTVKMDGFAVTSILDVEDKEIWDIEDAT